MRIEMKFKDITRYIEKRGNASKTVTNIGKERTKERKKEIKKERD